MKILRQLGAMALLCSPIASFAAPTVVLDHDQVQISVDPPKAVLDVRIFDLSQKVDTPLNPVKVDVSIDDKASNPPFSKLSNPSFQPALLEDGGTVVYFLIDISDSGNDKERRKQEIKAAGEVIRGAANTLMFKKCQVGLGSTGESFSHIAWWDAAATEAARDLIINGLALNEKPSNLWRCAFDALEKLNQEPKNGKRKALVILSPGTSAVSVDPKYKAVGVATRAKEFGIPVFTVGYPGPKDGVDWAGGDLGLVASESNGRFVRTDFAPPKKPQADLGAVIQNLVKGMGKVEVDLKDVPFGKKRLSVRFDLANQQYVTIDKEIDVGTVFPAPAVASPTNPIPTDPNAKPNPGNTPAAGTLAAPTNLKAAAEPGKITLTWTSVDGAKSYSVKRSTKSGLEYTSIGSVPAPAPATPPAPATTPAPNTPVTPPATTSATPITLEYKDSSAEAGADSITYYYIVSATNDKGEGANSTEATAKSIKVDVIPSPVPPITDKPSFWPAVGGGGLVLLSLLTWLIVKMVRKPKAQEMEIPVGGFQHPMFGDPQGIPDPWANNTMPTTLDHGTELLPPPAFDPEPEAPEESTKIMFGWLQEVDKNGNPGPRHPISRNTLGIGRHKDNDVRIINDSVSAHHASVHRRRDGNLEITDLNSANGVYVNGKRVAHCVLKDDDLIEVGEVRLRMNLNKAGS